MPRCAVLGTDGQERSILLSDRAFRILAHLHAATLSRPGARGHAARVAGFITLGRLSGVLATHAVALSAMTLSNELLRHVIEAPWSTTNWNDFGAWSAEIESLWAAVDAAAWNTFDDVGLSQAFSEPVGVCASAHLAARAVFVDTRNRVLPVLRDVGFLMTGEAWETAVQRLQGAGPDFLKAAFERLEGWRSGEALALQCPHWRIFERVVVAEVAGAAQADLVQMDDGGPIDQGRFATAINAALGILKTEQRQDLFSRWRWFVQLWRQVTLKPGDLLPSLFLAKKKVASLSTLTVQILQDEDPPKQDTPALFNLLEVLREVSDLQSRQELLGWRADVPAMGGDFHERMTAMLNETLPKAIRTAAIEVDRLALMPEAGLGVDPAGRAPEAPPSAAQPASSPSGQTVESDVPGAHDRTSDSQATEDSAGPSPAPAAGTATPGTPDPAVQWVPATTCIDDQRKDATAVRRFCEAHNVRTHRPAQNRLLVDWDAYQAARKAIAKSAERELDDIAERREAEKQRKQRAADKDQ